METKRARQKKISRLILIGGVAGTSSSCSNLCRGSYRADLRQALLVENYLSGEVSIQCEADGFLKATEWYASALCNFEQAVLTVSQIQKPQKVHLAGAACLLLACDRPVEPTPP